MSWWIWVLVAFGLLAIEFASTTMHIGFFAAGALLVGLLVAFGWDGPLWAELLVFTASSLVTLLTFRPMIVRKLHLNTSKTVDTFSGQQAVALEDIAVQARGTAELSGSTWSAHNVGTTPLRKGERCTVDRVDGLLLLIRSAASQEISHG
jgi:inner membrane protein